MTYGVGTYGTGTYGFPSGDPIINESLVFSISPILINSNQTLTDLLALAAAMEASPIAFAHDPMAFTDAANVTAVYAILDSLLTQDDATAIGAYLGNISDPLALQARLTPVLMQAIQDALVMDDDALAEVYRMVALSDSLVLASAAGLSVSTSLAETLALAYILRSVQLGQATDSLLTADAVQTITAVFATLADTLLVQSSLTGLAIITVLAEDVIDLGDDLTVRANYLESLADGLGFSVSLVIDGIPFLGIAMNTETRGITRYSNYGFNSLANFNGVLYGANEVGLFRLDGETDNGTPIEAFARTGLQRIANGKQARVDCAYIGYRSDGTMQMKVTISGDRGQKLSYIYDMQEVVAESTRPNRVKFGRGLKAAYWSFQISNTNGSDFDADIIEIHPIPLERRVP